MQHRGQVVCAIRDQQKRSLQSAQLSAHALTHEEIVPRIAEILA
jgi:hypothetical protein